MKKIVTLVLSLSFLLANVSAQVSTAKRIEFELKKDYTNFDMAEFGENGILCYSQSTEKKGKIRRWKIEKYSKKLELLSTKFLDIPSDHYLDETYTTDTDLYMLFRNKKGIYSFYKIKTKTLAIKKVSDQLPSKAHVTEIHVIDNHAFFDVRIKKAPMLITLDLESERQKLIPITVSNYDPKKMSIEDIQVVEKSKEVLVYVNAYDKKEHDLYVLRFGYSGEKLASFNLTKNQEKKISSISASYLGDKTYIYTGTYSNSSSVSAQGVYLCKTKNDKTVFFKFYNFLDFDKFLTYLPEKKQEKIAKKKKKKEKKGKELELNYMLATHDIVEIKGQYFFLGEAFYATYRTESYTTTGANGQMVTRTRTVFDGYQYTHTVLAGFDTDGEKLWDNTFEMWPSYKPYYAKKFITTSIEDDRKIHLLFASRNSIEAKSFYHSGEVSKEQSYSLMDTKSENDKVKYSLSNLDYWYGDYFIAHGNQKIKNTEVKGKNKRRVYFINKIRYK